MKNAQAYTAIQAAVVAISQKLGGRYQTCYLYGSLAQGYYQPNQSDINLIFIFDDDTSMHDVREAFQPVWAEYGEILRRAPIMATETAFLRHMRLHPTLARHIAKHGKRVKGSRPVLTQTSSLANKEQLARLASFAIQASLALTPELMEPAKRDEPLQLLRSLVRQLRRGPVDERETAAALYAELQTPLHRKMEELDLLPHPDVPVGSTAYLNPAALNEKPPYDVPNLKAVYEKMNHLLLAVDEIEQVREYPWGALAKALNGQYGGLQITTRTQMRLAVKYETPLEYVLRSYRHVWGYDPLKELDPPPWRILRDAARFASNIQLEHLPHAYLTTPDDPEEKGLRKLIHDFQNKLLNLRLQNELMARFGLVERIQPAEPLPDREEPSSKRIAGIFDQLDWWANFYTSAMYKTEV